VVERAESGGGFTLLDGASLVIGAAVASVHMRGRVTDTLAPFGWGLVWLTFTGVALSAAGPFVFLARRYGRRPVGYPRIGDWLWTLLGTPWVGTALLRPLSATAAERDYATTYGFVLSLSLFGASMMAMIIVWKNWVVAPPGHGLRERPWSWTERIGLGLAIAWPVQCGLGLVVSNA
jgi:hypothetical protein